MGRRRRTRTPLLRKRRKAGHLHISPFSSLSPLVLNISHPRLKRSHFHWLLLASSLDAWKGSLHVCWLLFFNRNLRRDWITYWTPFWKFRFQYCEIAKKESLCIIGILGCLTSFLTILLFVFTFPTAVGLFKIRTKIVLWVKNFVIIFAIFFAPLKFQFWCIWTALSNACLYAYDNHRLAFRNRKAKRCGKRLQTFGHVRFPAKMPDLCSASKWS